eukprot:3201115-Pyramimonas_sp.AAC.1
MVAPLRRRRIAFRIVSVRRMPVGGLSNSAHCAASKDLSCNLIGFASARPGTGACGAIVKFTNYDRAQGVPHIMSRLKSPTLAT